MKKCQSYFQILKDYIVSLILENKFLELETRH